MQYKALAFAAFAASVSAQTTVAPEIQASVLSVLLTALPPSALSVAATNQPALISEVYSSISAGSTPAWYESLPGDVKTILALAYPAPTSASTTSDSTATPAPTTTTSLVGTGGPTGGNSTVTTVNSPTLSRSSSTGGPTSTAGAAPFPTAVLGAGVAGALGFLGALVL